MKTHYVAEKTPLKTLSKDLRAVDITNALAGSAAGGVSAASEPKDFVEAVLPTPPHTHPETPHPSQDTFMQTSYA